MPVINIKSHSQYTSEKSKPGVLVVKYSAEWCGPCKRIAPEYEKLSDDYSAFARFLHVDVDIPDMEDEDDLQDIKGVPTFKFFKNSNGNSREIDQFSGADLNTLKKYVDKYCAVTLRS
jgi:thioredoxin 1